jgi:hypothetical protein
MGEARKDIEVEGLAQRARLLGPIEYRNGLHRSGHRGHESFSRPRPIEGHLHYADLLALVIEVRGSFIQHFATGADRDRHAFGVRMSRVAEESITSPRQIGTPSIAFWTMPGIFS